MDSNVFEVFLYPTWTNPFSKPKNTRDSSSSSLLSNTIRFRSLTKSQHIPLVRTAHNVSREPHDHQSLITIQLHSYKNTTTTPNPNRRKQTNQISGESMAAASINTVFHPLHKPIKKDFKSFIPISQFSSKSKLSAGAVAVKAVSKEQDVIPVQSNDITDHQVGSLVNEIEVGDKEVQLIGGFGGSEGRLSFEGGFSSATVSSSGGGNGNQGVEVEGESVDKLMDRGINAAIVLAAGTFGITKLLTIDYDYWHVSSLFYL